MIDQQPQPQPSKMPMSRPVTITIHEPCFKPMKKMAQDLTEGSVSELIRLLLYRELLSRGYISKSDIRRLK